MRNRWIHCVFFPQYPQFDFYTCYWSQNYWKTTPCLGKILFSKAEKWKFLFLRRLSRSPDENSEWFCLHLKISIKYFALTLNRSHHYRILRCCKPVTVSSQLHPRYIWNRFQDSNSSKNPPLNCSCQLFLFLPKRIR